MAKTKSPYNKKLDKAGYDAGRNSPKYPWVQGSCDILGATTTVYADPDNYEKSFTETFRHDGSFRSNETDGESGLSNGLDHQVRNYASGGTSNSSDGHQDVAALDQKGSLRENFAGDKGSSAAGNQYTGAGESQIGGSKDGSYNHDNGDSHTTTTGDRVSQHTGNTNISHQGDHISNVTGNKMDMVKGEYGLNVQGGNMDIQIDSGKFRVKSGADLIVTSDTKVTIVVGGSQIVIDTSGITITSSGDITTQGSTTKIQGGGVTAPPTTFT